MFNIEDVVVYSSTGVCKISDICSKNFGGISSQYYVLMPLMQKTSTVFVPVNNERLTRKIHPILSEKEFEQVFNNAKGRKPQRPEGESERREKFGEILDSGDREALILMVYDLSNHKSEQLQNGRRLHLSDERLLASAKNLLLEELSYVFKIDPDCAWEYLDSQMR